MIAALLALTILAVFSVRLFSCVPGNAVTYDESVHVTRGYAALKLHDLRLNIEHPVLGDALASLPLLAEGDIQFPSDTAGWRSGQHWIVADDFLWHRNHRPQAMVDRARRAVVVMSIALAIVVAVWAAELYGWIGALLALLLYSLSPTVIANSILATNDLSLALFSTLYLWTAWRFARRPGLAGGASAAAALAAAVMCKYSGLVLVVDTVVLLTGWWLAGRYGASAHASGSVLPSNEADAVRIERSRRVGYSSGGRRISSYGAAVLSGAAFLVWLAYGLRVQPLATAAAMKQEVGQSFAQFIRQHAPRPDDRLIPSPGVAVIPPPPLPHNRRWRLLTRVPIPAPQYLRGLAENMMQARGGHRAFLLGHVSRFGWWYYFPVAFLVKTPIPFLLLIAFALGSLYLYRDPDESMLWAPILILCLVAMRAHIDIGIRHLLPIYPLLAVFCGRLALAPPRVLEVAGRRTAAALIASITVLVSWFAYEGVAVHPYYLTYFNQIAGGPDGGRRFLVDSNLDWGQDLMRLACELNRRGINKGIGLAYFGTAEPAAYGILFQPVDPTPAHTGGAGKLPLYGWVAASVSELAYFGAPGQGLAWLNVRRPLFTVGHTILVYHIPLPAVKPGEPKHGARVEQIRKLHSDQLLE